MHNHIKLKISCNLSQNMLLIYYLQNMEFKLIDGQRTQVSQIWGAEKIVLCFLGLWISHISGRYMIYPVFNKIA